MKNKVASGAWCFFEYPRYDFAGDIEVDQIFSSVAFLCVWACQHVCLCLSDGFLYNPPVDYELVDLGI